MFRVYVAAPYEDRLMVREHHEVLRASGFIPTATWCTLEYASDADATPDVLRTLARQNDCDLDQSEVLIVFARHGAGGEMFCEARYAVSTGLPILWIGRHILTTYRRGVYVVHCMNDALALLEKARETAHMIGGVMAAREYLSQKFESEMLTRRQGAA